MSTLSWDRRVAAERAGNPDIAFEIIFAHFDRERESAELSPKEYELLCWGRPDMAQFPRAFVRALHARFQSALNKLEMDGWISISQAGAISLRERAFFESYSPLDGGKSVFNGDIPAADRFVTIDHNSGAYVETIDALTRLSEELQSRNDLPLEGDEAKALALEISTLLAMLKERCIRLAVVLGALSADGMLGYLKGKFRDHALGGAVGAAIAALLKMFGLG